MTTPRRPKLAVWKLASCDGCQLSLLDCGDELLTLAGGVDVAHFLEASSRTVRGPYDLSLVEGSVTTPADAERIRAIRRSSRLLMTIGACATAGGIQALRDLADIDELAASVYPAPEMLDVLARSSPVAEHVMVDFELHGCPVDRHQLLDAVGALLQGRRPAVNADSVCVECKLRGLVCVLVGHGVGCLGPVTHAGCGALCPAVGRGCYGCFGPKENPNTASLAAWLKAGGVADGEIVRSFRAFTAGAPAFRREADDHDAPHD
jgi:coenzyme F420-reducing hydrogenase gamma subunit